MVLSASEVVVAIYVHHMNDKVNSVDAKLDPFKWLIVSVIIVVGVYCNNYFAAESVLYRVFGLLMLAAAAGWLAAQTIKGKMGQISKVQNSADRAADRKTALLILAQSAALALALTLAFVIATR